MAAAEQQREHYAHDTTVPNRELAPVEVGTYTDEQGDTSIVLRQHGRAVYVDPRIRAKLTRAMDVAHERAAGA